MFRYMTLACARRFGGAVVLAAASSQPAVAQTTPDQLMRGVFDAVRQGQARQPQQQQQQQPQFGQSPPIYRAQPRLLEPTQLPRWPSKDAFLADARAGLLLDYRDPAAFERDIYAILVTSFNIPLVPSDCRIYLDLNRPFASINRWYSDGLSNRPPDFGSMGLDMQKTVYMADIGRQPFRDPWDCPAAGGGRHPYQDAVLQLSVEYERAVATYVLEERDRRVRQYRAGQSPATQQTQQRQATARAEEQERIDIEATRIRAAEQQRRQKDRARLGG